MLYSNTKQTPDNKSWKRRFFLLCIATIAVITIAVTSLHTFTKPLGKYDEGFALTNSWRMLNGDIPHRDYWAAYPPGTSLVVATAFFVLEPSLLVARLVNLGWSLLLIVSIFFLLKQFSKFEISAVITTLSSLLIGAFLYPSYSALPALAFIFLALSLLTKGIKSDNRYLTLLGGCIAGIVTLFRHDFSGYLFFSIFLSIATILLFCAKHRPNADLRHLYLFSLSFLLIASLTLLALLCLVGASNFIEQAIVFPATGMRENRFLPYPGFLDFVWAPKARWLQAWIVPMFIGAVLLYIVFKRPVLSTTQLIAIIILITMSALLTIQAHNRLDLPHAAPAIIFCLCLLAILTSTQTINQNTSNQLISWSMLTLFCGYSIITAIPQIDPSRVLRCVTNPNNLPCIPVDKLQTEVVGYINKNHPDRVGYIFVGNTRHDKVFINDASLYFLLQRPIPVKWNELHPGIITSEQVQSEIIKQMEAKNVELVVLADMPEPQENNASSISSGIHSLDVYISKFYCPVFSNSKYVVLQRIRSSATCITPY